MHYCMMYLYNYTHICLYGTHTYGNPLILTHTCRNSTSVHFSAEIHAPKEEEEAHRFNGKGQHEAQCANHQLLEKGDKDNNKN